VYENELYIGEAEAATPDRPDLEAAALDFAAREWPVFRLRPGTKEPFHGSRGFYDATTDPETIRRLWRQSPNANVGIATGPASGVIVLDVDPDKQGAGTLDALVAEHGELPPTYTVRSGGGGLHHYFRYPRDPGEDISISAGKLGPGLDVRAKGGYIVAAGSRTEGPYELLEDAPLAEPPEWLIALLRRPQRPASGDPGGRRLTVVDDGGPIFEGARNNTLTAIAGRLHDGSRNPEDLSDELRVINGDRCQPPLPASEVEGIARSIARRDPCRPGPKASAEVLAKLDRVALAVDGASWPGIGGKSERDVMISLIKIARAEGREWSAPVGEGVRVRIAYRRLALSAAVGAGSAHRAVSRLKRKGWLRGDSYGRADDEAGALVLVSVREVEQAQPAPPYGSGAMGYPVPPPATSPRLRHSRGVYESMGGVLWRVATIRRLGKSAGHAVDVIEHAGGRMTLEDLYGRMYPYKDPQDRKRWRPKDLLRDSASGSKTYEGPLTRLGKAGVLEISGDEIALTPDWLGRINRRREEDQEIADFRRDTKRYQEDTDNNRGGRKAAAAKAKPDRAPTQAEMDQARENRPDGLIGELERVPDVVELDDGVDVDLLAALAAALIRWPDHRHDYPSWWASTLHVEGWLDYRPDPGDVARALAMLPGERAA
jgi:hypothetical protein